ncbi:hypothetical protein MIZ03_3656 [Rhodoferax lithotrophicus]|uniref:Uncharacterized protein n=1 Tax=Rhodoferax lithotrophicus TaxID=2798804 RepID=A0ABM7MQV7_9BURK|nr:hypothetical protein [Rhodoferax sp. MIZ03]BCO28746.1 hypothetical protein MIZ03_3656 [Rhodoferax sp. MIZ03]
MNTSVAEITEIGLRCQQADRGHLGRWPKLWTPSLQQSSQTTSPVHTPHLWF